MSDNIAYQNKDITSKLTAEYFREKSLAAYGLKLPRITDVLPTNLPVIEANELRLDNIFAFADGSYGIIDYESSYNYLEQKIKYLNYVARVAERYRRDHKPLKKLRVIIIYTGDVESNAVNNVYDIGCIKFKTETAFLSGLDAEKIFKRIRNKILSGKELTEKDQMHFIVLPLAKKTRGEKLKALREEIDLAKRIKDPKQGVSLLSALVVFSDKIISKQMLSDVRRWIQMTQIGRLYEEEKIEAVNAMAKQKDEQRLRELKQKDEERLKELKQKDEELKQKDEERLKEIRLKDEERLKELRLKDEERLKELRLKDEELKQKDEERLKELRQKDEEFAIKLLTETDMSDEEIVRIVDVFSPAQIREFRKRLAV